MRRNNLTIRQKTKISQKLPADLEDKIASFQRFVIGKREEYDYPLACIGNMDETPVFFDLPANRTVDSVGAKTGDTDDGPRTFTLHCCACLHGRRIENPSNGHF
jgi:hypothetical protein